MKISSHDIRKDFMTGCPACGSAKFFTEIESRDFESGTGSYRVECCRQCGMRFTNPRPTADSLYDLYAARESADYVRPHWITERLRALAIRRWIGQVTAHAGPLESALDYGCGDGFFSNQLARCDTFREITAVDLHDRPPFYLEGLNVVRYRSFEQLRKEEKRYHFVFCRHVIEHIPYPSAVLADLEILLAAGGTLVVEVPNFHSMWRKVFGRYYFGLYLPRHLLHFDQHTLRALFRGYEQVKLFRTHTPVLGQSLGYLSGLALGNLGLIGLGLFPLQVLVDKSDRSSSVLSLVLRKQA